MECFEDDLPEDLLEAGLCSCCAKPRDRADEERCDNCTGHDDRCHPALRKREAFVQLYDLLSDPTEEIEEWLEIMADRLDPDVPDLGILPMKYLDSLMREVLYGRGVPARLARLRRHFEVVEPMTREEFYELYGDTLADYN